MRVLLVNELGGGLGHLVPLAAVATAFGPAWHCRLVVPDPVEARVFVAKHSGIEAVVHQAPAWRPPSARAMDRLPPTHNFADALHTMGLGEPGVWRRVMRFWSELFEGVRPDLVVTDAAPGVRLAAAGRVPVMAIGNGYSMPPPGRLLPSLATDRPDVPPTTRRREALILAAVNEVQAERGGPTLDYVADLFNGDAAFVGTHPALDPYRAYRTGSTWWPCAVPPPRARKPAGDTPALLFAYLHDSHPALDAVLQLFTRIGDDGFVPGPGGPTKVRAHVYVHRCDPGRIAKRCGPAVTVHDRPVDIGDLLSRTRVLVHHGGTGMSHEALAGGAAQLLLPVNLEQVLTSRSLQQLGVGLAVPPPSGSEGAGPYAALLQDGLERLLHPEIQAEAARRADELRASDFGDTLGAIVATGRRLAGAPSG